MMAFARVVLAFLQRDWSDFDTVARMRNSAHELTDPAVFEAQLALVICRGKEQRASGAGVEGRRGKGGAKSIRSAPRVGAMGATQVWRARRSLVPRSPGVARERRLDSKRRHCDGRHLAHTLDTDIRATPADEDALEEAAHWAKRSDDADLVSQTVKDVRGVFCRATRTSLAQVHSVRTWTHDDRRHEREWRCGSWTRSCRLRGVA